MIDKIILEWGQFNRGVEDDQWVLNLKYGKVFILFWVLGRFDEVLLLFDSVIEIMVERLIKEYCKIFVMRLGCVVVFSDEGGLMNLRCVVDEFCEIFDK